MIEKLKEEIGKYKTLLRQKKNEQIEIEKNLAVNQSELRQISDFIDNLKELQK